MFNKDIYFITGNEQYNNDGITELKRREISDFWDTFAFLIKDDYDIAYEGDPKFKILKVVKKK